MGSTPLQKGGEASPQSGEGYTVYVFANVVTVLEELKEEAPARAQDVRSKKKDTPKDRET